MEERKARTKVSKSGKVTIMSKKERKAEDALLVRRRRRAAPRRPSRVRPRRAIGCASVHGPACRPSAAHRSKAPCLEPRSSLEFTLLRHLLQASLR